MAEDPGVSGAGWAADPVSSGDPTSGGYGGTFAGGGKGIGAMDGSTGEAVLNSQKTNYVAWIAGILTALSSGSILAGVAIGKLVSKGMSSSYAKSLVSKVSSGKVTPTDAARQSHTDIENGVIEMPKLTEKEAIDAIVDVQSTGTVQGPERIDMENTVKGWLRGNAFGGQSRDVFENPFAKSIVTAVEQLKSGEYGTKLTNEDGMIKSESMPAPEEAGGPATTRNPTSLESEMAKFQLDVAKSLREKINDPMIMQDIMKTLPTTSMSQADLSRFTEEYSSIKQQVAEVGVRQSTMAAGQRLDDLVSRGVISQEFADKQQMKNQAATNAVIRIANKKLDAARVGMARNQYFQDAQSGLRTVDTIQAVDDRNRQIYNGVISQALSNLQRKQNADLTYQSDLANAAMSAKINKTETDLEFNSTMLEAVAPMASDALRKAIG